MSLAFPTFGQKLAGLRENFGQDRNGLAERSGIAEERIAAFEVDDAEPTGDEILILADFFKKDFRFFVSKVLQDPDDNMEILFREHGGILSVHDRAAISEFVYLCRNQAELERMLSRVPKVENFIFRPAGNYYKGQGQECARRLRVHLGLADNEVSRDLFAEMRAMGFKVFRRRLENSKISGIYLSHPQAGACILVNLAEGMARQRFSAAHEWGHALLDSQGFTISTVADSRSQELVELRANAFASEFLIPPQVLRTVDSDGWTEPARISEWSDRLRVSVPALLSALVDDKLVSQEARQKLRSAVPRPPEPYDPELEGEIPSVQRRRKRALLELGLSQHYVDLCFDAFSMEQISLGALCDMLLTDSLGVREVAFLFGRSIVRA